MSATAFPQPKTGGARPPFEPPFRTTFDGGSDDRDPMHKVYAESVKHLLNAIKQANAESLPLMYTLVLERKAMIEKELHFERMMAPSSMPPLLMSLYTMDFLQDDAEPVMAYVRLLDLLDETAERLRAQIQELNR